MGSEFRIIESVGFDKPSRVTRDEESGLITIHSVKYLGSVSSNVEEGVHNEYPLQGRIESESLYDGASCYLNHVSRANPDQDRGYEEKIGRIRGPFTHAKDGSRASLLVNPHHPLAEKIAWDAEHSPSSLGLSHSAAGHGEVAEGSKARQVTVTRVRSVDLVAAAATSSSLFESEAPMSDPVETPDVEEVEAVEAEAPEPVVVDNTAALEALQSKIDALEAQAKETARVTAREKMLSDSKLPDDVLQPVFVEQVIAAKDDATATALIEGLRRVAFTQNPEAAPAAPVKAADSVDDFRNWMRS